MQIAGRLGLLGKYDMEQNPGKSHGVASEFETWRSTIPITAQIIATLQGPAGPYEQPWGPVINLQAAFAKDVDDSLLGRTDFFVPFAVIFQEAAHVFHLEH